METVSTVPGLAPLLQSCCVVNASKPCFELCTVKAKPTNDACNFEPHNSHQELLTEFLRLIFAGIFEVHFGRIVKNHEAHGYVT